MKTRSLLLASLCAVALALPAFADEVKPGIEKYLKAAQSLPVSKSGSCDNGMTKVSVFNDRKSFVLISVSVGSDYYNYVNSKEGRFFAVIHEQEAMITITPIADRAAFIKALEPNAPQFAKSLGLGTLDGTDCKFDPPTTN